MSVMVFRCDVRLDSAGCSYALTACTFQCDLVVWVVACIDSLHIFLMLGAVYTMRLPSCTDLLAQPIREQTLLTLSQSSTNQPPAVAPSPSSSQSNKQKH
ncbi:hypothetical protein Q3G72_015406 [Acer saccharum]|nr:hypothetical protein Q3G72_015406 [Acer saccharum]